MPVGRGEDGISGGGGGAVSGGNDIGGSPGGLFGGAAWTPKISVSPFKKNVPFSTSDCPCGAFRIRKKNPLSSSFKELRNLSKDDESLRAKGKDRWYVPDPNKAGDLEKLRERSLLKEFEDYRTSSQKRLKVFRLEAVRAGFKKAWQERDYATIITVARKIPENVLQEDPKLLMWYDQALTRTGGDV